MKRISKNGKKGGSIPEFAHPFVKGRREKKTGASRNKREILKFSCVIWRKISLGQLCLQKFTTSNGEMVSDLRGAQCVRYATIQGAAAIGHCGVGRGSSFL